ncbi:MAG TPA: SCO family protein [Geminicoccaceae bacterium]|nr:SCO family protein [Geminicoccaceae bacterium]
MRRRTLRAAARAAPILLGLALGGTVHATTVMDAESALRLSQAALGNRVGDHVFRDSAHRQVRIADFRGRPLLVSLVYTGCTSVCPVVLQSLASAVDAAQEALGRDAFAVVTIGFDVRQDTPERMRGFARSQGIDLPNWQFLSADRATVDRLAAELGFAIYPTAAGFEHAAQTSIIDEEGIVYRHIYGGVFEAPAVVEPLKDLIFGRWSNLTSIEGLANRVRLLCTLYDPRSGRYRLDFSLFLGIAIGGMCLSAVGIVLVREWRRSGRAGV